MMIYLTRVPSEIRILGRSTDRYRLTPEDQLVSLSATALQGPLFSIATLPQPRQELLVVAQPLLLGLLVLLFHLEAQLPKPPCFSKQLRARAEWVFVG
ncbi:hypothetical protein U1Q18_041098, partial [Sarracenia purpurea var. burkii]